MGRGTSQETVWAAVSLPENNVFADDKVNELLQKQKQMGFIWYTSILCIKVDGWHSISWTGHLQQRSVAFTRLKPGASMAVARRGRYHSIFDAMNKYFGICQMPVAGSTYWNQVAWAVPGGTCQDEEEVCRPCEILRNRHGW